ncbi:EAL domain-containing protein [Jannaschia marina]|uniref:EAL domain-containing protein n=1 Tax=Jannaschia marina TaxID=2741674 RepID=UPI0015CA5448|nr:GGDEF domain-containing phosphodiesterase [Jannaschia marina]
MDLTDFLFLCLGALLGGALLTVFRKVRANGASAVASEPQAGPPADDCLPGAGCIGLLDIEGLSGLNAREGVDAGDRLIHGIADVLTRAAPSEARVRPLDRGRFLIWLPSETLEDCGGTIEELRSLASSTVVSGRDISLCRPLSAGVVRLSPGERTGHALLRASEALEAAKRAGGRRTEIGGDALPGDPVPKPTEVVAAIDERAIEYHVQPICRLSDGVPVGIEALLRWTRADGEILGPNRFIDTLARLPESEIAPLSDMAFNAAERFVTADPALYFSVNVTGSILDGSAPAAYRWLDALLERLPPEHLVLEVVETALIVDPSETTAQLERLRARGVRIALDDFGTGLSNLDRLRRYPVDIVKMDRVFVAGLGRGGREEAIFASLVALMAGLDIDLIAEGIETEAQLRVLRDLGVPYGQGFHLGRPAAPSDWRDRLRASPAPAEA